MRSCRVLELPDEALCVAASNDSRFLAVGLLDNTACIHFVDTLKFFVSLYGHALPVTAIDISHVCFCIRFKLQNQQPGVFVFPKFYSWKMYKH